MAIDFNSSLPVRTETNGDVVTVICDPTTTTQKAAVTANNELQVTVTDANGTPVDPRDVRALTNSDVVTADQGEPNGDLTKAWPVKITDGTETVSVDADNNLQVGQDDASKLLASVNVRDGSGNSITSGTQGAKQCLDVELSANGALVSNANPIPVAITSIVSGTAVMEEGYDDEVAAAGSFTHTYTVPALKIFTLHKITATSSGKAKMEISFGATRVNTQFNSTANPNMLYEFVNPQDHAAAATINIKVTNRENQATDLYVTIEGVLRDA